ncbi:DDE-type integrase/transposase/recombinase [Legionella feeleii]|uniref:DDE-type integrase/transposase/recombinase n=1 Tax=Legionella feeleii TaxID=453 RepID=UPI000E0E21D9|nr:DDE-type integrase/transposase/recombinase [Legionella feeleii]
MSERLLYRGIEVNYETVRQWCIKLGPHFNHVVKKREPRPSDKWHLDEQQLRINGEVYYLWRAVNEDGLNWMCCCRSAATKKPLFASTNT